MNMVFACLWCAQQTEIRWNVFNNLTMVVLICVEPSTNSEYELIFRNIYFNWYALVSF